jgi:hypothetical protein
MMRMARFLFGRDAVPHIPAETPLGGKVISAILSMFTIVALTTCLCKYNFVSSIEDIEDIADKYFSKADRCDEELAEGSSHKMV